MPLLVDPCKPFISQILPMECLDQWSDDVVALAFLFSVSLTKHMLLLPLLCVCIAVQRGAVRLDERNTAMMAVDLQGMRIFMTFGLAYLQFADQISDEFIRLGHGSTALS